MFKVNLNSIFLLFLISIISISQQTFAQSEDFKKLFNTFVKHKHQTYKEIETASLIDAVNSNNVALVKRLIDQGADVNQRDSQGRTPLMLAAMLNDTAIMKELITAKAHLNARDNDGNTALLLALQAQQANAANLLLKYKPDYVAENKNGTSLLIALDEAERNNKIFYKKLIDTQYVYDEIENDLHVKSNELISAISDNDIHRTIMLLDNNILDKPGFLRFCGIELECSVKLLKKQPCLFCYFLCNFQPVLDDQMLKAAGNGYKAIISALIQKISEVTQNSISEVLNHYLCLAVAMHDIKAIKLFLDLESQISIPDKKSATSKYQKILDCKKILSSFEPRDEL